MIRKARKYIAMIDDVTADLLSLATTLKDALDVTSSAHEQLGGDEEVEMMVGQMLEDMDNVVGTLDRTRERLVHLSDLKRAKKTNQNKTPPKPAAVPSDKTLSAAPSAVKRHLLDVYEHLGINWGQDPFEAIQRMKDEAYERGERDQQKHPRQD